MRRALRCALYSGGEIWSAQALRKGVAADPVKGVEPRSPNLTQPRSRNIHSISRIQQVLQGLPRGAFHNTVEKHRGDRYSKGFSCWDQLVVMVYAQLSDAGSLRQIEAGFNQHRNHHYHLGTRSVRRTTLSDANQKRNPQIFADTALALMQQAGSAVRKHRDEMLYLLDSTSIALR